MLLVKPMWKAAAVQEAFVEYFVLCLKLIADYHQNDCDNWQLLRCLLKSYNAVYDNDATIVNLSFEE